MVCGAVKMSLLSVENLAKSFGGVHAVDGLSFEVEAGQVFSIIGPNGAGKTTLLNLITGIYEPTTGSVVFDGKDVTGLPSHILARHGISRSFQNLQIFDNMSAIENVMVGHHLHVDSRFLPSLLHLPGVVRGDALCREYAAGLMAYVGLEDFVSAEADAMPYGALKRLEIARALASKPRLLLLDEPAAGLNPAETRAIDKLIMRIAEDGTTIILVEHDMHLIWGVSDRVLVLDHGAMLTIGTADEIRENPEVIAAYLGQPAKAE